MSESHPAAECNPRNEEAASSPLITTTFVITGANLDPADCTRSIGLEPTDVCAEPKVTGRLVPSGEPYVRKPYWSIELKKQQSYSTDEELKRLLDLLWPKRAEIVGYLEATGYEATFTSSVTIHEDRPLYELSAETLKRLAYFDVEWVLDVIY